MKRVFTLIAALLFPLLTMAQDEAPPRRTHFKAGFKVGANLTSLDADNWDNGYRVNFMGGFVLGVRANRLGLQAEALFVQNTYQTGTSGAQIPGMLFQHIADSARQGSFRVSQLSVPVLVMLRLPGKVWLQAGPQYNHVLSVSEKNDLISHPEKLFKSEDISGVVGLEFMVGRHFSGGARYVFGFTDINNVAGAKEAWKTKSIQLHLGYFL